MKSGGSMPHKDLIPLIGMWCTTTWSESGTTGTWHEPHGLMQGCVITRRRLLTVTTW